MPYASKADAEEYRARKRARTANDPAKLMKKRAEDRAHYHRNKLDPKWNARKRANGKASMERRGERRLESGSAAKLKKLYGISRAEFNFMHNAQGGVCAICKRTNGTHRLAVDHCHTTGKVRGLLCHNCNQALGKMQDDPAQLRAAAEYLERQVTMGAV